MKTNLFKKNFTIASILTILLSFTFLSCDDDGNSGYTVNGALNYNTSYDTYPRQTNDEGQEEFHVRFDIEDDIEGYTNWDELYKIDVINSLFELRLVGASFYPGDNIIIELADYNYNEERLRLEYKVPSTTSSLYIKENDRNYFNFVRYLFQELKHYGYIELNIFVDMIDRKDRPITKQKFDVFFENNLKLYYWKR